MKNYWNDFLPGPLPITEYRKNLPYFLSESEKRLFEDALKVQPADWIYRTKEIRYDLNKSDYRTKEWDAIDWEQSIVVLGCSHVFGEGNSIDETMCYQLEKITGREVVNLGVTGSSPLFSWHNSLILNKRYPTPYAIVQVWSSPSRMPYYAETICKRIGPWSGSIWDEYDTSAKKMFELWNESESHTYNSLYFTAEASKVFWSNKTRYAHGSYFNDVSEFMNISYYAEVDLARDLIHYGELTHRAAAEDIAAQIERI
jgi:hypothetical protein